MKRFPSLSKFAGVFLALILVFGATSIAKASEATQGQIDALYNQVLQLIIQVQTIIRQRQLVNYNQTTKAPVVAIVNPVSVNQAPAPVSTKVVIDSLSPTEGGGGTVITLTGHGFKASGNTVIVGGITYNVGSSDGKTLTITLPNQLVENMPEGYVPPPEPIPDPNAYLGPITFTTTGTANDDPTALPLWIYLKTDTGFSNSQIFNFYIHG